MGWDFNIKRKVEFIMRVAILKARVKDVFDCNQ